MSQRMGARHRARCGCLRVRGLAGNAPVWLMLAPCARHGGIVQQAGTAAHLVHHLDWQHTSPGPAADPAPVPAQVPGQLCLF